MQTVHHGLHRSEYTDEKYRIPLLPLSHSLPASYPPVNCISIPRLFYLAGTAVPFFIGTAFDNCQNLGIFMSCIEGKVYEIRYTGVYVRMADDLTSGIHQITVTQLIDLLMQIAQCLRCCIKSILSLRHRECAGVGSLSVELDTIVKHTQNTVYHADVISGILQDRTLFNVRFKHILVLFRISYFFLLFIYFCLTLWYNYHKAFYTLLYWYANIIIQFAKFVNAKIQNTEFLLKCTMKRSCFCVL